MFLILCRNLRLINVGPNSLRLAQPHYDTEVHEPYLGFRESASLTSEELLNLTIIERTNLDFTGTPFYKN